MILIILRGPMGSGKSEVGQYLREKLKGSSKLDLDINANGEVSSLDEVLGKEYVVGELYDGGSHTTDPQWINKFKERGYDILSVILDTKLETCIYRVNVKRGESYSEDYVKGHYDNFHQRLRSIFKIKAAISEISIDANEKQPYEIRDEILKYLGGVN